MPESDPQPRLRLTDARNDRDWSQQQVADKLGTTHVNVSRWERGITKPNPFFRRKLCKLFGKTEEELDLETALRLAPASSASSNGHSSPDTAPLTSISTEPLPSLASIQPALYDSAIPLQPAIPLVGREEDLARIKLRLRNGGNVALTALNGLPGVGKTALSITLAHDEEIRAHFRDGILWAGLGPAPNVPSLLSRWGSLLGISQTEMATLGNDEAWARALRSAIGPRAMLLVIDDAWALDDTLKFKVGGANCAHLVTTRFRDIASHIAIGGATEIQELSEEQSMDLLRLLAPDVIEHEAQKAQTLVHAVGGLPLALTLMGNYLRKQGYSGQTRRITAALERLTNAEERLQISEPHGPAEVHPSLTSDLQLSLQSVIAVTDQVLSPSARVALYALSVFPPKPNSFSEDAALAVAGCDYDTLDALTDSGLLESSGSGRYTLHQTIADYARLHLTEAAAYERLIAYVIPFVEAHKKDYERLDEESHIILAALEAAHAFDKKAELIRIVTAFVPYFLRGFYTLAERHLQRAHEAAVELGDTRDITTTLLYLGEIAQQQGNFTQAEASFQEGLSLARQIEDNELVSAFLHNVGWVAQKQGNLKQADAYLQEGLNLARQIEAKERICGILKVLGLVALYSGRYAQGETYLQEGLNLARQIGDYEQISLLLINLGVASADQGNYAQAEIYYQEGLVLARQTGHKERISALLANLGDAIVEQGNYTQAEEYFREGLALARQIEHREWTSVLLCNLGLTARQQRNYIEAEIHLQEGLTLTQQIGIPQITANILYEYGNLYLDLQRIHDAEIRFREMLEITPKEVQDLKALAQYGLARSAAIQGDIHEARNLGEASVTTMEQIGYHKAIEVRKWLNSIII